MSTLHRLVGMAHSALDKNRSTASSSRDGGSRRDWRSVVRDAADSVTGDRDARTGPPARQAPSARPLQSQGHAEAGTDHPAHAAGTTDGSGQEDRRAIARYDYLVRTAEPEQLERVHREAFGHLTPHQRAQLTGRMRSELPEGERPRTDAPDDLARSATRLGVRDPRGLKGLLARVGNSAIGPRSAAGIGAGALGAGAGLLGAVAGGAVVSGIGGSLLQEAMGSGIDVDALADGFDLDHAAQDGLSGLTGSPGGDQVFGFGEKLSGLGPDDL